MKLTGSYKINLEKQKVWEALNDPEILKQAIPGCEEFNKKSETEFSAKATNKIGPFNATFSGDIELKDLNPPNLIYSVEAQVGGKIAQVGSRLIDMTAKKMADIFFGKFSELISSEKNESTEITESDNQKVPETKMNYTYFAAAVVLGIFLIYWMFLK
jgi:carbon monoxide dehydrogenase subunit G